MHRVRTSCACAITAQGGTHTTGIENVLCADRYSTCDNKQGAMRALTVSLFSSSDNGQYRAMPRPPPLPPPLPPPPPLLSLSLLLPSLTKKKFRQPLLSSSYDTVSARIAPCL